jgi:hypothetical protein
VCRAKPCRSMASATGRITANRRSARNIVGWLPSVREADFSVKWLAPADSGHYINFSQPEKLAAVIRSFLPDQPPPFLAYQGDEDPRPPLKNR